MRKIKINKTSLFLVLIILIIPFINHNIAFSNEIIEDNKLIIDELFIAEKTPISASETILLDAGIAGMFLEEAGLITRIKENSIQKEIESKNSGDKDMELEILIEKESEYLKVYILLENKTERNRQLTFKTGQKYEIEIYEKRNGNKADKIYKWSRGQMFTQAIEEISLEPEEKKEWQVNIPFAQLNSNQDYIIKAWITDRDKTGGVIEKSLEL